MSFIRPQLMAVNSRSTFMEDLHRGEVDYSADVLVEAQPQRAQREPHQQGRRPRQQPSRPRRTRTKAGDDEDPDRDQDPDADQDPDGDQVSGVTITDLNNLPALLTVEETAGLLRTTTNAIYTMASRGKLPGAVHVGRRLLVRRRELLEFLNEGRVPSPKRSR